MEKEKLFMIEKIIRTWVSNNKDNLVNYQDIIDDAIPELSGDEVDEAILHWKSRGVIYEPKHKRYGIVY